MSDARQPYKPPGRGPFRADQIPEGSPYELSNGHPLLCVPGGGRHSRANVTGALVIGSDPGAAEVGIDTGYAPEQGILRAPDIAVGNVPDRPGWVQGVPPLAIEYADTGQGEADLADKIAELLDAGTRYLWVVRLVEPRRVEVYEQGQPMRTAGLDEVLTAPGVLTNPIPVRALFERDAALEVTLRNLLARAGYKSLDEVRAQGVAQGITQGITQGVAQGIAQGALAHARGAIRRVLERRGVALTEAQRARVAACGDVTVLDRWLDAASVARDASEVFGDARDPE